MKLTLPQKGRVAYFLEQYRLYNVRELHIDEEVKKLIAIVHNLDVAIEIERKYIEPRKSACANILTERIETIANGLPPGATDILFDVPEKTISKGWTGSETIYFLYGFDWGDGTFSSAQIDEFIAPYGHIKIFTAEIAYGIICKALGNDTSGNAWYGRDKISVQPQNMYHRAPTSGWEINGRTRYSGKIMEPHLKKETWTPKEVFTVLVELLELQKKEPK